MLISCDSKSEKIKKNIEIKTLKQNTQKEEKDIYKEKKQVSVRKEKYNITTEFLLKFPKIKIRRLSNDIKEIKLPAKCFFLSDSVDIYTNNSLSSKLLNYGEILYPYNVLSCDGNWLKIEFNKLEGYAKYDSTIYLANDHLVTPLGANVEKNITDFIYEVWENTNNKYYEKALTRKKDSTIIHKFQRNPAGPSLITIPFKLYLYLNAMENLQYKNPFILESSSAEELYLLIQIWKNIGNEYGSVKIYYTPVGTADIVSKFQIADIYANNLSEPDSSILIYLDIVTKYPNIQIGGYEWNNKADIWAFEKFLRLAKSNDTGDDEIFNYNNSFLNKSTSKILDAIIILQLNEYLFKNKQYSKVEENLKLIIAGIPLPWSSFKTYGDIQAAAIWQWQHLGSKFIGNDYSIEAMKKTEKFTSNKLLISISNYFLAELYRKNKNIENYKKYLSSTLELIQDCDDCSGHLSLSPLPQNYAGPFFNTYVIKDSLNKL